MTSFGFPSLSCIVARNWLKKCTARFPAACSFERPYFVASPAFATARTFPAYMSCTVATTGSTFKVQLLDLHEEKLWIDIRGERLQHGDNSLQHGYCSCLLWLTLLKHCKDLYSPAISSLDSDMLCDVAIHDAELECLVSKYARADFENPLPRACLDFMWARTAP